MDIMIPLLAGLGAAGIIWGVATFLEKKQLAKKENLDIDEELYED